MIAIYIKMDQQYDEETNHHANRPMQWKWDAMFAEKIRL
jgi:hypothetical protein